MVRSLRLWFAFGALLVLALSGPIAMGRRAAETRLVLEIEGKGRIVIKLHSAEAPRTTAHIAELASQRFYDGQRFFKVIRSPRPFLAQIGDPDSRTKEMNDPTLGTKGSGKRIPFEDSGFKHSVGSVGLARLPENRDSGDSQFYILLGQAGFLDGNYTVFGQVVQGMELLPKLELGDRVSTARVERL